MNTENNTNRGKPQQRAHNVAQGKPPVNRTDRQKQPARAGAQRKPAPQPQNRRVATRPLTEEERMRIARERAEKKALIKKIKKERREVFVARLIATLMLYALILGCAALFVYALYSFGGTEYYGLHIKYDQNEKPKRIPAEVANIDGAMYISATDLGLIYSFTLAGDKEQVTLYFHGIDQDLSLFKNSSLVEINGANVRLSSEILFTDDYYIPVELIEKYFYGAKIEPDEYGRTVITRTDDNDGFYLRVQAPAPTSPA